MGSLSFNTFTQPVSDAWKDVKDPTLGAATLGTYTAYKAGKDAQKAQERAQAEAKAAAERQAAQAERDFNAANQKKPNIAALMAANAATSFYGNSGTFLTGPQGVDAASLILGRQSLLGT